MSKYRVWAKMTTYSYLDVEADCVDEAETIAKNTDGGEFITTNDGNWEVNPDDNIQEVDE